MREWWIWWDALDGATQGKLVVLALLGVGLAVLVWNTVVSMWKDTSARRW